MLQWGLFNGFDKSLNSRALGFLSWPLNLPSFVPAQGLDELHKLAVKEGGTLNFYATLAQINAEKIIPVFRKRFPGIKVNHVDATSDKLVARAVTEARGGKTLGDVLQVPLENVTSGPRAELLLESNFPESAEYPEGMKGTFLGRFGPSIFYCLVEYRVGEKRRRTQKYEDFAIHAGKTA